MQDLLEQHQQFLLYVYRWAALPGLLGTGAFVFRAVAKGHGASPQRHEEVAEGLFRAPCVPFVPCLAILFNCFLLSQFEAQAWLITLGYLVLCVASYFAYGYSHSVGGRTRWQGAVELSPGAVRDPRRDGSLRDRASFVPQASLSHGPGGAVRVSGRLGGAIRVGTSAGGAREV